MSQWEIESQWSKVIVVQLRHFVEKFHVLVKKKIFPDFSHMLQSSSFLSTCSFRQKIFWKEKSKKNGIFLRNFFSKKPQAKSQLFIYGVKLSADLVKTIKKIANMITEKTSWNRSKKVQFVEILTFDHSTQKWGFLS